MKGEIIYKILNSLADVVVDQIDFTNAILHAGYGASAGKMNYEYSKLQNFGPNTRKSKLVYITNLLKLKFPCRHLSQYLCLFPRTMK